MFKLSIYLILIVGFFNSCSFFQSPIIDGYTNKTSYIVGEESEVFINSEKTFQNKKIKLYDVNGKKIDEVRANISPQTVNPDKPWENGFKYKLTFKYKIPDLQSGIYFWDKKIAFIVKSSKKKRITIVYPSNTVAAYCSAGGKCFYSTQSSNKKESKVLSFNRPQDFPKFSMPFFKWIAKEKDYSCNYISDMDLDNEENFNFSKILILVGHNEYWTRRARQNFDSFVNNGGNAMILSGNTMWWQVRYSEDKSQIYCFKHFEEDPIKDSLLKTINWFDERLKYPIISSIGGDFRLGGYGRDKDKGWDGFKIVNSNSPLFEGTNLKNGDILSIPTAEYDGAPVVLGKDSIPSINRSILNFHKIELLGFDFGERSGLTVGTFIVFKKKQNSGIIINASSTDWCSSNGIDGIDSKQIKNITKNMINKLLKDQNVFSK